MNDDDKDAARPQPQYSLQELAAASGIDARLIRFLIARKLLPAPEGKARASHYTDAHLVRAQAIHYLREVEKKPYPEIQSWLAAASEERMRSLIVPANANLQDRIRALRERLQSPQPENPVTRPAALPTPEHKDLSGPQSVSHSLTMMVRADRALGWNNGGSVRHAVISIAADRQNAPLKSEDCAPNMIVAVIDCRSQAVRVQASGMLDQIIEELRPEDRLAIIWGGKTPAFALHLTAMDRAGKQKARLALQVGATASAIDLVDAWLAGAEELSTIASAKVTSRIFVITDAGTDKGEDDPRQVAHAAEELSRAHIQTVAVGMGARPDIALLHAMEAGGDVFRPVHIGETIHDLGERLIARHLTLRPLVARDCQLVITPRLDGAVDSWKRGLIGLPGEDGAKSAARPFVIPIGDLRAGCEISVPVRLHFPDTRRLHKVPAERALDDVEITLTSKDARTGKEVVLRSRLRFHVVAARENDTQPADLRAMRLVAISWLETIARRAIALAIEDRRQDINRLQTEQFRFFGPYVGRLPEGAQLTAQFGLLFESLRSRWKRQLQLTLT